MGFSHDKGYRGEIAVAQLWAQRGRAVTRPRAGAAKDVGDLVGLPIVQSVKNCRALALSEWVDGMVTQADNAGLELGVVWHHRPRKGNARDWYCTTRGDMAAVLIEAYCDRLIIP